MTEAPKQKEKDPHAWGEFFREEFKSLKLRTGIRQEENLTPDELTQLIGEMVMECKKPPYDQVDKVILQRVIHAAVVDETTEFIGFSIRWIRKALSKWWFQSGWKVVEKMQREKEAEAEKNKPAPVLNPHENIHETVNNYVKSLLAGNGMQAVPQVNNIAAEGKEWTSGVERRGTKFKREVDPMEWNRKNEQHKQYLKETIHMITMEKLPLWMPEPQWIRMKEFEQLNMERNPTLAKEILRVASDYYHKNGRSGKNLEMFEVEGYYVIAETQDHAKEIYSLATKHQ
jgi:hypothetical protein